jgi:hypothetical protein
MYFLILFASLCLASKDHVSFSTCVQTEDSQGWIQVPVHNCSTLQSVTWFSDLKNILYDTSSTTTNSTCPMEYVCIVATNTLRAKAIWNAQNKAYVLITSNRKKGGKWFTIMTITNGHPTTFVSTIIVTTGAPTGAPTSEPVIETTIETTGAPTGAPTSEPVIETTIETTGAPTGAPTSEPVIETTIETTDAPTGAPTSEPVIETTIETTGAPTGEITSESTIETTSEPPIESTPEVPMDQKNDVTKANVMSTLEPSSSTPAALNNSRVVSILLGSFGILVVFVVVLITLRKPSDQSKKTDSVDDYGFEKSDDFVVIDTKKEDQAILRSLGKGANEAFEANL